MLSASLFSPLYAPINKGKSKKQNITGVCFCLFVQQGAEGERGDAGEPGKPGPKGLQGPTVGVHKQTNKQTIQPADQSPTSRQLFFSDWRIVFVCQIFVGAHVENLPTFFVKPPRRSCDSSGLCVEWTRRVTDDLFLLQGAKGETGPDGERVSVRHQKENSKQNINKQTCVIKVELICSKRPNLSDIKHIYQKSLSGNKYTRVSKLQVNIMTIYVCAVVTIGPINAVRQQTATAWLTPRRRQSRLTKRRNQSSPERVRLGNTRGAATENQTNAQVSELKSELWVYVFRFGRLRRRETRLRLCSGNFCRLLKRLKRLSSINKPPTGVSLRLLTSFVPFFFFYKLCVYYKTAVYNWSNQSASVVVWVFWHWSSSFVIITWWFSLQGAAGKKGLKGAEAQKVNSSVSSLMMKLFHFLFTPRLELTLWSSSFSSGRRGRPRRQRTGGLRPEIPSQILHWSIKILDIQRSNIRTLTFH